MNLKSRWLALSILCSGCTSVVGSTTVPDAGTPPDDGGDVTMADAGDGGEPTMPDAGPSPPQDIPRGPMLCEPAGDWCWVYPQPIGAAFASVHGVAADDVWAVGEAGITLHWDGAAWSIQPTNQPSWLTSVWARAHDDAWTVGYSGAVLHWDGAHWSPVDVGTTADLRAVWAAATDDVWITGAGSTLVHYDGSAWTSIVPPAPITGPIWGSSDSDVWMASQVDSGTYALSHWDGTSWSLPITSWTGALVTQITGTGPDDVWVVGDEGSAMRWDGNQWSLLPPPPVPYVGAPLAPLFAGWSPGGGVLWALDGQQVLRWSGQAWEMEWAPSMEWETQLRNVGAIWGVSSGEAFAVGGYGAIARKHQGTWTEVSTGFAEGLGPITGIDGELWAVNADNLRNVARYDGASWTYHPLAQPPSSIDVQALWGSSTNDVWVGGREYQDKHLWHWDGNAWSAADDGTPNAIVTGLWGTGPKDIWSCGYYGQGYAGGGPTFSVVRHYDGTSWTTLREESVGNVPIGGAPLGTLCSMSAGSVDDLWVSIYAANIPQRLLHWDGQAWTEEPGPGAYPFVVTKAGDIWGAGGVVPNPMLTGYAIFHRDATGWHTIESPFPDYSFDNIWADYGNEAWIAARHQGIAQAGALIHFDGESFTKARYITDAPRAFWGRSRDDVWIAGQSGLMRGKLP